jgi:hypothetical protein
VGQAPERHREQLGRELGRHLGLDQQVAPLEVAGERRRHLVALGQGPGQAIEIEVTQLDQVGAEASPVHDLRGKPFVHLGRRAVPESDERVAEAHLS